MGWRVTDQRQTYNMSSGGKLAKVWEITVDTSEGPSFTIDVPLNLYSNTEYIKQQIEEHYSAMQAAHQLNS